MQSKSNRKMFMKDFLNKTIASFRGSDSRVADSCSGYSSSEHADSDKLSHRKKGISTKYPYGRPGFLEIVTEEEMALTLDHSERNICVPKRMSSMPLNFGYAECTNGGKSKCNEDQAIAVGLKLQSSLMSSQKSSIDLDYDSTPIQPYKEPATPASTSLVDMFIYGIFDGHAGPDVAVTVSHELPFRIKERLMDAIDDIEAAMLGVSSDVKPTSRVDPVRIKRKMTMDELVTGALQASFHDMDANLVQDKAQYTVKGGCTSVVSLFFAGKLYVANAGDSRAVMKLGHKPIRLSHDCTPETERKRLQLIAEEHPQLLGDEFCSRQFSQRVTRKDLGTQMFYRDSRMDGWANKEVTEEDLRFPMIIGEGRRARLLATIGVTRGLGDHDLKVFDSQIYIKPFLTPSPEVRIFDMNKHKLGDGDVVIMASDGLWDVITDQEAVDTVDQVLTKLPELDTSRYTAAAVALVSRARGMQKPDRRSDVWFMDNHFQEYASHDDISCIVIPLKLQHQLPHPIPAASVLPARALEDTFDAGAWTLKRKDSSETKFEDAEELMTVQKSEITPNNQTDRECPEHADASSLGAIEKSKEMSKDVSLIQTKSSSVDKQHVTQAKNIDASDDLTLHSDGTSERDVANQCSMECLTSEDVKSLYDPISGISIQCDLSSENVTVKSAVGEEGPNESGANDDVIVTE